MFTAYSMENTESKKKVLFEAVKKFWNKKPEKIEPKHKSISPITIGHVNDSDELYLEKEALGAVINTKYNNLTE